LLDFLQSWDFIDEIKIAQGTFAEVYMATVESNKLIVAVKKIV
jgi:serine/threonine protein kinase